MADTSSDVEGGLEQTQGYAVAYGCILALGLPLNAVSLWILLRRHSLKSPSAVFMVNLAMSDLLLVTFLPTRIYFYWTGTWPFGRMACLIIQMLFRNNIRSSSIFITFISVDRLLAIVYPLRSRHLRTSSNAWKAAAVLWLFVVLTNIPEINVFLRHSNDNDTSTCFKFLQRSSVRSAAAYLQLVVVCVLLAVNIVCTAMVLWTLRSHLSASARVQNKVNVMLIFAINFVMFTICILPVSLGVTISYSRRVLMPMVCLASVNCCLDPLLYYFSFDAFWKKKENNSQAIAL
ncbi:lysophosphatidic acid receptor 6-like [Mugil cephalus]|uniref:lysophosphatidic acid receptor 6-like n=1 Tax=Mugil cephalus TaxID=48193 RepID=UPI001FB757C5|nr:lysophosphatidic acid receptor 6-like [Mugil cephalus]